MPTLMYRDPADGQFKPTFIPATGGTPVTEAAVGVSEPTDPNVELWVDTDDDTPPADGLDDKYVNSGGDTMTSLPLWPIDRGVRWPEQSRILYTDTGSNKEVAVRRTQTGSLAPLAVGVATKPEHAITERWLNQPERYDVTFAPNWGNYGGLYKDVEVWRSGGRAWMDGLVGCKTAHSVTTATNLLLATMPTGVRPTHEMFFPVIYSQDIQAVGQGKIIPTGEIYLRCWATGTFPVGGFISLSMHWRVAD